MTVVESEPRAFGGKRLWDVVGDLEEAEAVCR
jgi:hypothetical protein